MEENETRLAAEAEQEAEREEEARKKRVHKSAINSKVYFVLLLAAVILAVSGMFLLLRAVLGGGAQTAEEAVWGYEKACMTYDADSMVHLSSSFNRYALNGNKGNYSVSSLKELLEKTYAETKPLYEEANLTYEVVEKTFYNPGEDYFKSLQDEYATVSPEETADEFAYVTINIFNSGKKVLTFSAYAVRFSERWYFFHT